ncbi:MAG: 3'(2'),5'-bisphosphate nucleotidase CysQ [Bacteroidales bacterium]|nr:3'(2'),5'-bisphosphate nucleotidase CysQ [Bacteroidales bacterium]
MKKERIFSLLEIAIEASIKAGEKILEIYDGDFTVEMKKDQSPLTIADTSSNEIINHFLSPTNIPVLSEEGKSIPFEDREMWDIFWMVDPLDGTKEFIKRNGEFTVNIALISHNRPVMGVIYIPVENSLYFGSEPTGSVKVDNISSHDKSFGIEQLIKQGYKLPFKNTNKIFTIVGSKSHLTHETEEYFALLKEKHGNVEVLSRGSSLKICMVAEGKADIYPRFAPTMEWDIAAGHAIATFAGASVINQKTKKELSYNSKSLVNPWFIVKRK